MNDNNMQLSKNCSDVTFCYLMCLKLMWVHPVNKHVVIVRLNSQVLSGKLVNLFVFLIMF